LAPERHGWKHRCACQHEERLRIARNGQDEPIELTIVRAVIHRKAQATIF